MILSCGVSSPLALLKVIGPNHQMISTLHQRQCTCLSMVDRDRKASIELTLTEIKTNLSTEMDRILDSPHGGLIPSLRKRRLDLILGNFASSSWCCPSFHSQMLNLEEPPSRSPTQPSKRHIHPAK